MMQALGYKDLLSGGCYNRCGTNAPATPPAQQPQTPPAGGNVLPGSFSYSSSVEVSFSSDAMQLAYSHKTEVSFSFSQAVEVSRPSPAQSMQSPATSAQNILSFVEDRLKTLKAEGASPEAMKNALEDGLKGYETGRDQAIAILKGYGMYEGPIKAGVEQTTELVKKGIEEMGKTYLGTGLAPATPAPTASAPAMPVTPAPTGAAPTPAPTTQAPVTSAADDEDEPPTIPAVSRYRAKLYTEDKLDLTVETRDGDTITISIEALQKLRVNGAEWNGMTGFAGLQGDGSLATFKGMYSESMLFEVDGELDDAEKAALDELIVSIMDLADSFYAGDMATALDKASQLSIDPAELASMSLEMTQTQYMRTSAATYRDVAGYGADRDRSEPPGGRSGRGLEGLGDHVRHLRGMADKASHMKNPKDFINELFAASFAQMDAMRQKLNPLGLERLDSLHRQLVDGALAEPEKAAA